MYEGLLLSKRILRLRAKNLSGRVIVSSQDFSRNSVAEISNAADTAELG